MAKNADTAGLDAEQARDQREQRALAGAVEAEQGGKARRLYVERDVDQRPARPVGMADTVDRQRRHRGRVEPWRLLWFGTRGRAGHGAIVMPQGNSPT